MINRASFVNAFADAFRCVHNKRAAVHRRCKNKVLVAARRILHNAPRATVVRSKNILLGRNNVFTAKKGATAIYTLPAAAVAQKQLNISLCDTSAIIENDNNANITAELETQTTMQSTDFASNTFANMPYVNNCVSIAEYKNTGNNVNCNNSCVASSSKTCNGYSVNGNDISIKRISSGSTIFDDTYKDVYASAYLQFSSHAVAIATSIQLPAYESTYAAASQSSTANVLNAFNTAQEIAYVNAFAAAQRNHVKLLIETARNAQNAARADAARNQAVASGTYNKGKSRLQFANKKTACMSGLPFNKHLDI
ncbi:hypothetical protein COEREDRAFT_89988 [Coemansia reversa NRRL 1564]|uniref:Uncharacterized protein n=1 Tax=Coemansia reversa (strain ATCC 12441 / NRRL 1564) TaxID=763665 RepID=A0A2G5B1L9_COERN|nr:hypothetical protein COEREDRAFT_89988 [Coemansia reversa NRRL 1564]|eukprot:PIA12905.1 hypothetical protein COEREDRAFT_89988 [Coemansia reversa NRRL 1564]